MGDPTAFIYQFIYNEKYSVDTEIIKYFSINGLEICFKVDNYVAHMFYAWSFIDNIAVTVSIKKNKCVLSMNTHTTMLP